MQSQNILSPSSSPTVTPILTQAHLPTNANSSNLSQRTNKLTDTGKISPSRLSLLTTISNSTSPLTSPLLHPYHEDTYHIIKSEVSDRKSVQCLENIKREINYKQQSQYVNFYQYFNSIFGPMNSFSEILKRCTHLTDISEEEMNKDVQFIKKLLEEDGSDQWQIDSQPQENSEPNLSSSNAEAVAKNAEQSEQSEQHSKQHSQGQSENSAGQPSDSCGYSFRSCSYNQNSQKQNIIRPASRHQLTQRKSSYNHNRLAEKTDNSYQDQGNQGQDQQSQPYENQPFSAYQSSTPSYLKNEGSKDKFEYQIAPIEEDDEDDLHVIQFSSSSLRQSQKENHMPPKSIEKNKAEHLDEAEQSSQNADTSNILASSKNISRSGDPLSQYFRYMNLKQEEDKGSESESDDEQSSKQKGKQKNQSQSSSQIERSNESSLEQSISMSSSEISQLDKIEDFSDSLSDQITFNDQSEVVSEEDQSDRQENSDSESLHRNKSKDNRMCSDQISDKNKKKIEKKLSKFKKAENDDQKEARRLLGTELQRNIEKAFIGLIKTVGESLGF